MELGHLLKAVGNPVVFFSDLSKAFDCDCHYVLQNKLQAHVIREIALNWNASFFCETEPNTLIFCTRVQP